MFAKHGTVNDCWVARQPAGFAFVTMDNERDAQDAISNLDGAKIEGQRIRVEVSRTKGSGKGDRGGSRNFRADSRSPYRRRRSPSYRSPSYGRGRSDSRRRKTSRERSRRRR
eukprot:GEMP01055402.1.p1 GENE.GEMP01055402.1~~GEMP01055402.1.p1  ORF type:complete len:112 (+),score=26.04 GEMP01055402.1:340-675(+)